MSQPGPSSRRRCRRADRCSVLACDTRPEVILQRRLLRSLCVAVMALAVCAARHSAAPGSDDQYIELRNHLAVTQFVSYSRGELGGLVNPAGLAAGGGDNGILFQFSRTSEDAAHPELNVMLSIGGLGLSYHEQREGLEDRTARLHVYGMSLAVGGSVLSLGNRVRMIEVTGVEGYKKAYDLDAGFLLQPIPGLVLGGVLENASEAEVAPGVRLGRRIRGGASLLLFEERLVVSLEGSGPDSVRDADEVLFRAGARVRPFNLLSLYAGAERQPGADEVGDHWFGADLHLMGWVTAGATAMGNRDDGIQRIAAQIRWGLASSGRSRWD